MNHSKRKKNTPSTRFLAGTAIAALAIGTAACESDSAGPEAGEVTTSDIQDLEEQIGAFDERLGALEEEVAAGGEDVAAGGDEAQAGAEEDVVGQEVTVSAEVTELITSGDVGSAFRIGGESGPSVAILSTTPPEGLEVDDVVQISGTVQLVNRDSFEDDFGVAETDLFDDPDTFFDEEEGQPAIAATSVEILQEQAN